MSQNPFEECPVDCMTLLDSKLYGLDQFTLIFPSFSGHYIFCAIWIIHILLQIIFVQLFVDILPSFKYKFNAFGGLSGERATAAIEFNRCQHLSS